MSCLVPVLPGRGQRAHHDRGASADGRRAARRCRRRSSTHGGAQCGICTPGMLLAALACLRPTRQPTEIAGRGAGRQPVPLHRLHEDLRGASRRRGRAAAADERASSPSFRRRAARARSTRRSRCSPRAGTAGRRDPARRRHRPVSCCSNAGQLAGDAFVEPARRARAARRPLRWEGDALTLSALTTYTDVRRDARVRAELPLLVGRARASSARCRSRTAARGRATSRTPRPRPTACPRSWPTTRVVELRACAAGARVALADYFTGYKQSLRAADELITASTAQAPRGGARHYWRKVGTRKLQAISKVVAAGAARARCARAS